MDELKQKWTGYIEEIPTKEDYSAEEVLGAVAPFDWNKGYRVEDEVGKLPHLNQEDTLTCVCCSTAIYLKVLYLLIGKQEDLSVRDIYSQIFQPGGGSYIRDAMKVSCEKGVCEEQAFITAPWTEAHVRERKDYEASDKENALAHLADEYRSLTNATNIDMFATMLREWHGVVSGIRSMGHCMYAKAAYLKNGKKTILFHNSWGEGSDVERSEDDFKAGDIVTPWSLLLTGKKKAMQLFSANGKRIYAVYSGVDGVQRRFWVLDPMTKANGDINNVWKPEFTLDPSVLNLPYGGAIFFSSTDDPDIAMASKVAKANGQLFAK